MKTSTRGVDPKVLLDRYYRWTPVQRKIILEGTVSLLRLIALPKDQILRASSMESLWKREKFYTEPDND